MKNKLLEIKKTLLMGPGPSSVSDSVYNALAKPTLGHLDSEFISLMDEIKIFLQKLFKTDNQLTLPISFKILSLCHSDKSGIFSITWSIIFL